MFTKLLLFVLFQSCTAVIHKLNDSDYALMPPEFHLDNYEECFDDPEALYCFAEYVLVSDEPSPLLTMIQEYSADQTHYNHSLLRHGYCINKTCKKFYEVSKGDLRSVLEACVNESFYNKYKLKARVSDDFDCFNRDRYLPIDNVDIAVGVICVVILMANLVGSLCDNFLGKEKEKGVLRFLYCFSIFRSWKKLAASSTEGKESRLKALKGLHGFRALTIYLVIIGHTGFNNIVFSVNPNFSEDFYHHRAVTILPNGTVIMQTFLIISSFLLVYNWLIYSEKHEPTWKMLPRQFVMRWLRLTPSYSIVLALTATWFGKMSSGPYWKNNVYRELTNCRRDWWKNLLYINNYYEGYTCMMHTWYLAVDTQLYYMTLIVFMMCRTVRIRKVVLSLLFVVGIVVPTLQTYFQHLDGILLVTPETGMKSFVDSATYMNIYTRGHTNLTGYIIGMALGYMIYDWQEAGGNPKKFQKYRYMYWTLFPLCVLCCFSACIFYEDTPPPTYVHLLFAAFMKPVFGILMGTTIAGVIIQFEGLYRTILEWRPWTYLSRLSFGAYLLHIAIMRNDLSMITATQRSSSIGVTMKTTSLVVMSFICAFFLWMLVEAPFGNLVQAIVKKPETSSKEDIKETIKESTKTEDDDNATDKSPTKKMEDSVFIIKM